jgi:hypothetical protein
MAFVGFEPTIPAFQRAKTVDALDRATNVVGIKNIREMKGFHVAGCDTV